MSKDKRLHVRIDQYTDDRLSGIAEQMGVSRATAVRSIIQLKFDDLHKPPVEIGGVDKEASDA